MNENTQKAGATAADAAGAKGATAGNGSSPGSGNLSVRQLAQSLVKTGAIGEVRDGLASGEQATEEVAGKNAAKDASRKRASTAAAGAGNLATGPSRTGLTDGTDEGQTAGAEEGAEGAAPEGAEGLATDGTDDTDAGTEGQGTEGNEEGTETEEGQEGEAQKVTKETKGELPEELRDAISIAKESGNAGVAKLLKRVHNLVDQRDTERNARLTTAEENSALRAELQDLRQGAAGNGGNAVTPNVGSPELAQAQADLANCDYWLGWLEENPQGGRVPDGKGGTVEVDEVKARRIAHDLQRQRQELVAQRVQLQGEAKQAWQEAHREHHAAALSAYPWLTNKAAPEYQKFQAILKVFPAMRQSPDFELAIGDFIEGERLRLSKAAAAAAGGSMAARNGNGNGAALRRVQPAREATRVVAEAPNGAGKREKKEVTEVTEAQEQFAKSGRTADLARSFAANRRVRR